MQAASEAQRATHPEPEQGTMETDGNAHVRTGPGVIRRAVLGGNIQRIGGGLRAKAPSNEEWPCFCDKSKCRHCASARSTYFSGKSESKGGMGDRRGEADLGKARGVGGVPDGDG